LLVNLLVLVAGRGAVDDDGGAFHGALRVVGGLVAEGLEVRDLVRVDGQPGAPLEKVVDLGPLRRHGRALVERDFVDAEVLSEVREEADQGLSDRAGADDVDDLLHRDLLCCRGVRCARRPEGYDETVVSPTGGRRETGMTARLRAVSFAGPSGSLEGLWKEAEGQP